MYHLFLGCGDIEPVIIGFTPDEEREILLRLVNVAHPTAGCQTAYVRPLDIAVYITVILCSDGSTDDDKQD